MSVAGNATVGITAVACAGIALADFVRAPFVLANSAEVKVPSRWLGWLGAVKLAGAAGLVGGLLGRQGPAVLRPVGVAAGAGLVSFFIGAVGAHLRHRVFHNIAFPLVYLGLAAASLAVLAR